MKQPMRKTVAIDCFPESVKQYRSGYAIVAIDVIRATTTAVTVVAAGRRCFVAPSTEAAFQLAQTMENPLLVGELKGEMPCGFDMNNSPAALAVDADIFRPVVLLSSSGTALMYEAAKCEAAYLACFRNYSFAARFVRRHPQVAVIGAGSRGEFREEDQMCCAWVGAELVKAGYEPKDMRTLEIIERWRGVPPIACANGNSATYLVGTGQAQDLEFILAHVNDLDAAVVLKRDEVVMAHKGQRSHAILTRQQSSRQSRRSGELAPL
jgi:2-phosphosulfolactate phosphatase